jgi:hypothetical protein
LRNVILGAIDKRRFDALAGYARDPMITLISEEVGGYTDPSERVLGLLIFDRIDSDFGWVVFGRDAVGRFRAIDVNTSYATETEARHALFLRLRKAATEPDEAFHQGDEVDPPVDFFAPVIPEDRLHSHFKLLLDGPQYSPAREIIKAMMRYHKDVDGNFVQKFQTAGFDALLWELYLFATFTELGYARDDAKPIPDFFMRGNLGSIAVEATSVNASASDDVKFPENKDDLKHYISEYIPIRLSTALRSKLNHKPPYWQDARLKDVPLCLAIQDFHTHGSMRAIVSAATEFVFGVRHSIENGKRVITRISHHRYRKKTVQSGFFNLPNAENISAIIINPQGTLPKFNRMGFIAGFGDPDVKMIRTGIARGDRNVRSPWPRPFVHIVDHSYSESWVEGMVVLHNRNAKIRLDPRLIPGAAHEFLQEDGSIQSLLPDFQPLYSETIIGYGEKESGVQEG